VRINEQRFRFVMESPSGPVGRHLGRTGARVESVAKALVTQERLVRTGRYRSSIAWRLFLDGRGLFVQVGSALPIARLIERGSPPHQILPAAKRALWWTHGADRGWLVPERPLASVQHPGTRPYMILHRAVALVLRGATV
jgi:bacteriophage HK97-gp10 putative tail-component